MTEICYRRPDEAYPPQVLQVVRSQGWAVEHDARPGWPAPVTSTVGLWTDDAPTPVTKTTYLVSHYNTRHAAKAGGES